MEPPAPHHETSSYTTAMYIALGWADAHAHPVNSSGPEGGNGKCLCNLMWVDLGDGDRCMRSYEDMHSHPNGS